MDEFVEQIHFAQYDRRILLGDMTPHSSRHDSTMRYLDGIFDLGNPATDWALGNHDRDSLELVRQYTGRPPFYASHSEGITWLIMDTMDSLCSVAGEQKTLVRNVCDTISESSHLVLLMHQLVWLLGHPELEPQTGRIINGQVRDCPQCIHPNNFYTEVYPRLLEVEKRGVEVICLAGDIGWKRRDFSFETKEGITFLASGIGDEKTDNLALLFRHDVEKRSLEWDFVSIYGL